MNEISHFNARFLSQFFRTAPYSTKIPTHPYLLPLVLLLRHKYDDPCAQSLQSIFPSDAPLVACHQDGFDVRFTQAAANLFMLVRPGMGIAALPCAEQCGGSEQDGILT